RTPLVPADIISMTAALLFSAFSVFRKITADKKFSGINEKKLKLLCPDSKVRSWEYILVAALIFLAGILMWTTFYIRGNQLFIGVSVFSDFSPHLGMIRSFSYGNNFPTQYAHYAGEDIRYHFMFQFLVGNLEFLGLRLDYAFNLPSMISLISAFLLIYLLAVKITGKIAAGFLACLFFAFRSSETLFTYLSNLPPKTDILKNLADNTNFISSTPNEDWGLWNLNVYCNQRHLAFGLTVMFLVIILFLPHLYEMFEAIKELNFNKSVNKKKDYGYIRRITDHIRLIFFTKEGWLPKEIMVPIAAGIMLGALGFFHGSAVIACLLILFVTAILSRRRIEILIVAVITLILTTLQTHFFIHGAAVSPQYLFGFIAENKTLFGVVSYLGRLLGILPIVLLAAFCLEKGVGRWMMLAFTLPLVFSFFVSLTIDVTVNHKFIMMSCILLGIFAATLIVKMFERRDLFMRIIAVFLVILLTATGLYDFTTVIKKNTVESPIVLNMDDPLTKWIHEHSSSKDIFLTSNYAINQVVFGGAMLYEGWQYFAWSAGYDTDYRDAMVKRMYEASTPDELDALVKQNKIRFIVVDQDNRNSKDYALNEDNIRSTYQSVYEVGEGDYKTTIYDTKLRIK
ncbi:MAG TPA: hypothetical protein VN131_01815, partial [Mobilitalea sp.]|nr:hypothetical protein [Mobilitalea sp.]